MKKKSDPLKEAVQNGDLAAVTGLLANTKYKNQANKDKNKNLRLALKNGHLEIAKALLEIKTVQSRAHVLDNECLRIAAEYGYTEIAKTLLSIDVVKNQASINDNRALNLAAKHNHFEIVEALLTIEKVRNLANAKDNEALREAAQNGHVKVVETLLAVDIVRNQADIHNNIALRQAAKYGHLDVVEKLLEVKKVKSKAAIHENGALRTAVKNQHFKMAELLLSVKEVREHADVKNNEVLRNAASGGNLDLVNKLLALKHVSDKADACENEALFLAIDFEHFDIVKALLHVRSVVHSVDNEIARHLIGKDKSKVDLELINQMMHVLGRPSLTEKELPEENERSWFNIVFPNLNNPLSLDNPYGLARNILELYDYYCAERFEENAEFNILENHNESSMDDKLLWKANERFEKDIHPEFENQFNSLGKNLAERLNAAELKIRLLILKHIQIVAQIDKDEKILQFVDPILKQSRNKQEGIVQNEAFMQKARELFVSKTLPAHIAWRCYDPEGNNEGWKNLFVPPVNQEAGKTIIFTTRAAFGKELTLQQATELVRERAAYFYLLVENEPIESKKEAMQEDFIFYLSEIKRANNKNSKEIDNPSCFPGTLTRLARIADKSSLFNCDIEKKEALEAILTERIERVVAKIFQGEYEEFYSIFSEHAHDPRELCAQISDAITGINFSNALDILIHDAKMASGYDVDSQYSIAHGKARNLVFKKIMCTNDEMNDAWLDQVVLETDHALQTYNKDWIVLPEDRAFIKFFINSLSEPSVLNRVGELYQRAFPNQSEPLLQKEELNEFEEQIKGIESRLQSGNEGALHSRGNRYEKLIKQNQLFHEIKRSNLSKQYSDETIVEIVYALTYHEKNHSAPALFFSAESSKVVPSFNELVNRLKRCVDVEEEDCAEIIRVFGKESETNERCSL